VNRAIAVVVLLWAVFAGALSASAQTSTPAVARPSFDANGLATSKGTAFFIRVDTGVGYAAVGTAHAFRLDQLTRASEVHFALGGSGERVATSKGLLTQPGRPFSEAGATLGGDFNVYSLVARPKGVRVLELSGRRDLTLGTRVRILGIPQSGGDQTELAGQIAELSLNHIEIDLEVPPNLRGWGGAPVVDAKEGKVIGILQANSSGSPARVSIGSIAGVRKAIATPLEDGAGRAFAKFGPEAARRSQNARTRSQTPAGERVPESIRSGSLMKQEAAADTNVRIEIEFPADGEKIADSICGAYVSGRAIAHHGDLRHFDVILVLDTSRSTVDPTGADINGNGVVGKPRLGQIGSIFDVGSTDPGDSILAAEVAAARQLLRGLDPRSTRVGVIRFAGEPPGAGNGVFTRPSRRPAVTMQPLTNDYSHVEIALNNILNNDPAGQTHIAAGVDQAMIELSGFQGALSTKDPESEKVVFFFTDGQPTLPYGPGFTADNNRAVLRAASRANRQGIRIHSFAIGPDALEGPISTIGMASRTNGYFTPVRHPGDLVDVVEEVSFANLEDVRVVNTTTGDSADPFRVTADGSWGGFVKLGPGANQIEVTAFSDDGTQGTELITLNFSPEAPEQSVPRELTTQRNRLLEDCLVNLKQVRMKTEERRNDEVRRELKLEIERERAQARQRAEDQSKQLDISIDEKEGEDIER
jgi:hypothetical protein